jgi:ergothioneine biosynthesis protein EgtB
MIRSTLAERFRSVRAATEWLTQPLSAEDQMVQSCPEASPVKWHLAHTTWFFETFVLREFLPGYRALNEDYYWLFNSYYKTLGAHPEKRLRSSFSRPSLAQILEYRRAVDAGVLELLGQDPSSEVLDRIELGTHHEQQHQELIATDIKHAFWSNPLQPIYREKPLPLTAQAPSALRWIVYPEGRVEIGHAGEGFGFDNESSCHPVHLGAFRLASRLVTCAEYMDFMEDDGYRRPELWLSEGWDTIQSTGWNAPLYWSKAEGGNWNIFTLHGTMPLEDMLATPVCHVSDYEADAYARWAGHRLPTEFEWERAAADIPVRGNFLESGVLHPQAAADSDTKHPAQIFGDCWEWTQSAYTAYPRYRPAAGALGEYNGKFMCSQIVLRGGSAATPASHIRATYRNFFSPATRWQFSGIRLAADGVAE